MKYYLVSTLAIVAILGGSVTPALADEGGGLRGFFQKFRIERDNDRGRDEQSRQQSGKDLRDELASKSQELKLKLQQKSDQVRRERLGAFWEKAVERLQKLIDREVRMSEKIGDRLTKFSDAGKDVSRQRVLLDDADDAIADAQTALTGAIDTLGDMLDDGSVPLADIIAKARELHKDVVARIRTAHRALIDVIVATRGMSITSTPSVSPVSSASPTASPSETVTP